MSSVFLVVKPINIRLYSLYKILYPKRRIESYSIMGTIVSPSKLLLRWIWGGCHNYGPLWAFLIRGLGFRV